MRVEKLAVLTLIKTKWEKLVPVLLTTPCWSSCFKLFEVGWPRLLAINHEKWQFSSLNSVYYTFTGVSYLVWEILFCTSSSFLPKSSFILCALCCTLSSTSLILFSIRITWFILKLNLSSCLDIIFETSFFLWYLIVKCVTNLWFVWIRLNIQGKHFYKHLRWFFNTGDHLQLRVDLNLRTF